MRFRLCAGLSLALLAAAATRPHYGGTLRVEVRDAIESADPPQTGPGMADLNGAFAITRWEAGRRAVFQAQENAPGGRPFVDSVDVQMGAPLRERVIDLGRADIVEFAPGELRQIPAGQRMWSSSPVKLIALVFGPKVEDARVREALALAVDRGAIHRVLLQGQGDISGGLLPQWISGYAFLFPTATDMARAKALVAAVPAAARTLTLAADDRAMADRIAVNAHDAGLTVTVVSGNADVRLVRARILSSDGPTALAGLAAMLGLPEPARAESAEALYAAERALLDGFHVIPLAHTPDLYAVGPRVHGGPGITALGEWRFENVWVEERAR
jgi:peptide/nickel transport system substrate-binding protein